MKELTAEIRQKLKDFVESPAGEFYISKLDDMISLKHYEAEESADSARDKTQHAKGIREAKNILIVDSKEVKGGRRIKK